jgi:hypothetical protein
MNFIKRFVPLRLRQKNAIALRWVIASNVKVRFQARDISNRADPI